MNKKGDTAEEAASLLLLDSNLSEWQVGFLAVVLDEVTEHHECITCEIQEALREANDPNAKLYTHEEVMQAMQKRIARTQDKPC